MGDAADDAFDSALLSEMYASEFQEAKMRAADDFSAIRRRMRELNGEIEPEEQEELCKRCDGGGWVMAAYQGSNPPNLEECPECYNPEGHPCP